MFTYEEIEGEILGSDNLPMKDKFKNLRTWLNNTLCSTDEKGEPDVERIYRNAAFNMGEAGIKIGMLAFKAKLRLRKLTKDYNQKRATELNNLHHTKLGWVPNDKSEAIMLDGDFTLSELKEQIECQADYLQFLEEQQDNIRYYARNADALARVHNFGQEIGKIIV